MHLQLISLGVDTAAAVRCTDGYLVAANILSRRRPGHAAASGIEGHALRVNGQCQGDRIVIRIDHDHVVRVRASCGGFCQRCADQNGRTVGGQFAD